MSLPNLRRRPLGQEVTMLLRRMIQKGELEPGERLVEERLAKQLGLSRTPVREALHRLEQEGLLSKPPRGGYEVHPISRREVEEAIGVRVVLEVYATELAAQRITSETLEELAQNLIDFKKAIDEGDEDLLVELNMGFHDLIYRAADSDLLYRLLNELHGEVERVSRAAMSNIKAGKWSLPEHTELYEALKAGDAKKAGEICREHVAQGGAYILEQIEEPSDKQSGEE